MTALATATLDPDELIARAERMADEMAAYRVRLDEARRQRPCMDCGARPSRPFLAGPLCASCAPAQPVGYCAPLRCSCPGDSCQRPA